MGRYCGILNRTKKQSISSYWKSDDWCNCYEVMHQFHWNKDDQIESGGGYEWYEIKYDLNTNTMELFEIDITAEMRDDSDVSDSDDGSRNNNQQEDSNDESIEYIEYEEPVKEEPIVYTKYGFDTRLVYGKKAKPKSYKLGKSKFVFVDEYGNVEEPERLGYITDDDDGIEDNLNNFDETVDDKYNHLPEWDGDKCTKCGYIYDDKMLAKYKRWFDPTFHFN